MSLPFCNVALPVPLRATFTYAIPETLRDVVQPGSRVVVPFRKKSHVGVVVECVPHAPEGAKIRELTKVLDFVPALTPKLLELGQWIAGYYLAPVGEVFRAMLPPVTELRTERQIVLTDPGGTAAQQAANATRSLNPQQHALLSQLTEKGGVMPFASAAKLGLDDAAVQRVGRAGLIEICESMVGRKAQTQGGGARRDRQRKNGSVHARRAGNAGARQDRDHSGAGNCADPVDRAAVPRVVRRAIRRRGGAALRAERRGTRARMVARAQRRRARGGGHALGDFCAAEKSRAHHRR